MPSFAPMKIGNCQQVAIPVLNAKLFLIVPVIVDNTIRLLIPIVVNNTNDAIIIIKYEIDVNNTSSIYTKINLKSSFLGLCYYLVR